MSLVFFSPPPQSLKSMDMQLFISDTSTFWTMDLEICKNVDVGHYFQWDENIGDFCNVWLENAPPLFHAPEFTHQATHNIFLYSRNKGVQAERIIYWHIRDIVMSFIYMSALDLSYRKSPISDIFENYTMKQCNICVPYNKGTRYHMELTMISSISHLEG